MADLPDRLPQRFAYKRDHDGPWLFGICTPYAIGNIDYWGIRADHGHASFDDDPWEVMGAVLGDVPVFRWIDNDFQWHPL